MASQVDAAIDEQRALFEIIAKALTNQRPHRVPHPIAAQNVMQRGSRDARVTATAMCKAAFASTLRGNLTTQC